ncbi:HAMP domain-containing histidine kinase [Nodosilinea sp. LEGE 07088]|uniref:sensor histidine kinase n=1 Tax=Nodosilinea sp. LEGE 07088 TaxID=2777968 RepID=UPI00187E5E2F|nr:HAMP domain-containing sensor histidine kinase [Nodosilinea sp. LEGE 07088]MBE9139265.1 HAMP domain-containing histidine kinase [Nodosilinea sp. LEGE 07088]
MIGSPSSEFVALCQSQVFLLTQALGSVSTVVYLAETTAESIEPTLVPLVAYPETADPWIGLREGLGIFADAETELGGGQAIPRSAEQPQQDSLQRLADVDQSFPLPPSPVEGYESGDDDSVAMSSDVKSKTTSQNSDTAYPLVLPLAHDGVVLGMMVSNRHLHPWTSSDYQQAEQVANTLALACVMDQRNQWLQRQLTQHRLAQVDQSDTFHDLLHQFRNPLTALQTFGKLMVKRLSPEDTNRPIVEGIVRESKRLQELAQHFDAAVAEGDETLEQSVFPSVGRLLLPGTEAGGTEELPVDTNQSSSASVLTITPGQGHGLGRSLMVEPGAIADVAIPLVQSTLPLAQERGLQLTHHVPTALPPVWLDPLALGEVLYNLLDNALKYAPTGSLVWVTAGLVQHFNHQIFQGIAVGDTGVGIPETDQAQLFSRHFRGVQAAGTIPGTGLGLAIVQDLVQGMGGHIDLISPVQGTPWLPPEAAAYPEHPGSLFVVWLRVWSE